MKCKKLIIFSLCNLWISFNSIYSQCGADAGPDQFTCDPTLPLQLNGSFNGVPTKYYWTPVIYLSDPNVTNPFVNAPPGKYKYTFNVEAVSNVNLIVNGDFESGYTGFTHDYIYGFPGGTFLPGYLGVGQLPKSYNAGWVNCGDHTSGGGNQLIVDGSTSPNKSLWCQTVSVTVGKMYLFRFFVQSVVAVAPAQLIAQADGFTFGSVSAAGACDWQTFEACFTATSSSAKMCIIETSLVGNGNDFAVDDIQMYEKCIEKDDVEIEIVDLKASIQVPKFPKCSSDPFDLNGIGSSTGPNISFEWRSEGGKIFSQNGLNAKGLGAGKYFIKVRYQNGKVLCEKEAEIEIDATQALEGTLQVEGSSNCKVDTILLRALASNGSGKFDYQWIPANKIHHGQHDSIAYVTEAGIYKVVIIDKDSGCEVEIQDVVISDTIKPNLQISGDTLISCLKKSVILFGNPFDTSKYSYEWVLPDSSHVKNIDSIHSKAVGLYSLKVIDKDNNCFTNKNWNVKVDTIKPIIDLGPDQIIDCIKTDITILPAGSNQNATIDYFWTLPSGSFPIETTLLNKSEKKAGQVILHLINTSNGCEASDTMLIQDKRKIPFVDAGNGTTLNCKIKDFILNGSNSKMDSTTFFWSTQIGNIASGSNTITPIINAPGWYYLHVEDTTNYCNSVDSVLIDQNILAPNAVLGSDKIFSCADSILTLDGSSSSSGVQLLFNWYTTNGIIDSGQNSNIIKVKSAGDYYLVILDTINFCSDTDQLTINPDLNAPIVGITINGPNIITCRYPSVWLTGTASSPAGNAIKYTWSGSSGQLIQLPNSLNPIVNEAGQYNLTVIDLVNGCSATANIFIPIDTIKPIAIASPDTTWYCNTIKLTLDASNSIGKHVLQFFWTTNGGGIIIGNNGLKTKIDIGGPGTYFLQVADVQNGCISKISTHVKADLNIPNVVILTPDTLTCINSTVTVSGQGSSVGNRIIYDWKTNDGQIIGAKDQINIIADKPGSYQLIVTDTINGCTQQQSIIVIENKQQPFVDAGASTDLSCQLLDLILTGNYVNLVNPTLKWTTNKGNILSKSDSLQIKIDKPGTYYLEVANTSNGCVGIDSVLVTRLNNLSVDAGSSTELTCLIKKILLSGSIQNNAGNEQIIWTTNQGHFLGNTNTNQVEVDRPGWYYFEVTNNTTGCNGIDSVLITENTNLPVLLNLDIQQPKCPGDSWQAEITNITGGEKPIQTYLDNQQINGFIIQGNTAGNYIIKVVDKNGCELLTNFKIISPQGVSIQLIPLIKLSKGQDYNLVPKYSIPDDSIESVQWNPADFLSCTDCPYPVIKAIDRELEYTVTYANRNGCNTSARIRIEFAKRNIWVPNVFSPNGDNINDWFYPAVTEESYNNIRSMAIYDRWGELVFQKENFQPNVPTEGWNGEFNNEKLDPGVFVYIIEVEWKNGEKQLMKGNVTLIK